MEAIMATLMVLCQEVTRFYEERKGIHLMCRQASKRLVSQAKKAGIKLEFCYGFFGMSSHCWTEDENGNIWDPTAGQFLGGANGFVEKGSARHSMYDKIPQEHWYEVDRPPMSNRYYRWLVIKDAIRAGMNGEFGHDSYEWRVSKRGDEYLYLSFRVKFSPGDREPQVRTALVFRTKDGGLRFAVLMQRPIHREDGRLVYPTYRVNWTVKYRKLTPWNGGEPYWTQQVFCNEFEQRNHYGEKVKVRGSTMRWVSNSSNNLPFRLGIALRAHFTEDLQRKDEVVGEAPHYFPPKAVGDNDLMF